MFSGFYRSLICVALAAAPAAVAAQAMPVAPRGRASTPPLTGRVVDATSGEALPGSTVLFDDLKQGTATGPDGSFSFANLPRGRFTVQVRSLGYNTVTQTVDTGAGQPLEFKLTAAATEIGQVVVTGVSQATQLRRSPVPTAVVDRTRLNQTSGSNLVDAIAHTPGLAQITTGAAISKPVVRGLGYNRVVTLNNGARQEGQQWGDEHGIEIDEFSVDRAEIIKGPGSLLYGSDAMAGVINFVAPDPIAEGRIKGTATANYQTNNHLQAYSFENAGNIKGLNWLARGTRKVAGDYQNRYDGRVYNSGFNEWDANGYVGLNKSWGYSHLTFSTFNQRLGLTEGARDTVSGRFVRDVFLGHYPDGTPVTATVPVTDGDLRGYGLAVPQQQINHLRIGTDNSFILGANGGRLGLQVSYQQNLRREYGNVLDPAETSLYFQLRTVDYSLRYFLPEHNGWNLTVGSSGLHQQNRNLGVEFLIPAYRTSEAGVFGVAKKSIGALDLSGGLRYDVRRIAADGLWLDGQEHPTSSTNPTAENKFPGFLSTFRNYSGSLGAAYSLSEKLTLKANLSRGFRAPNIAELGSNGKHEGTIRYEIGNDKLAAETSLQVDAGVSYVTDHVRFGVDAFTNSISNYIFTRRLLAAGGADSLRNGTLAYKYEQGQARLYGGEVSLDFHPHPLDWLHFENSFSLVRARQLNVPADEQYLPFIPGDRLQSELRANFRRQGKRISNPYARVQLEHTFAQDRFFSAFGTETATPGYTLINAGLGTDVASATGRTLFSLYLTANNLFDVAYQSHLSRLKYADFNASNGRTGVFNQGRNVSVRLVVPLSFK